MVEFKYAIHKKTGQIVSYEDWKKGLENPNTIFTTISIKHWKNPKKLECWDYRPMDIILKDDFEIVYNDDFTLEDYINIDIALNNDGFYYFGETTYNPIKKVENKIKEYKDFEIKYGRDK